MNRWIWAQSQAANLAKHVLNVLFLGRLLFLFPWFSKFTDLCSPAASEEIAHDPYPPSTLVKLPNYGYGLTFFYSRYCTWRVTIVDSCFFSICFIIAKQPRYGEPLTPPESAAQMFVPSGHEVANLARSQSAVVDIYI